VSFNSFVVILAVLAAVAALIAYASGLSFRAAMGCVALAAMAYYVFSLVYEE